MSGSQEQYSICPLHVCSRPQTICHRREWPERIIHESAQSHMSAALHRKYRSTISGALVIAICLRHTAHVFIFLVAGSRIVQLCSHAIFTTCRCPCFAHYDMMRRLSRTACASMSLCSAIRRVTLVRSTVPLVGLVICLCFPEFCFVYLCARAGLQWIDCSRSL